MSLRERNHGRVRTAVRVHLERHGGQPAAVQGLPAPRDLELGGAWGSSWELVGAQQEAPKLNPMAVMAWHLNWVSFTAGLLYTKDCLDRRRGSFITSSLQFRGHFMASGGGYNNSKRVIPIAPPPPIGLELRASSPRQDSYHSSYLTMSQLPRPRHLLECLPSEQFAHTAHARPGCSHSPKSRSAP